MVGWAVSSFDDLIWFPINRLKPKKIYMLCVCQKGNDSFVCVHFYVCESVTATNKLTKRAHTSALPFGATPRTHQPPVFLHLLLSTRLLSHLNFVKFKFLQIDLNQQVRTYKILSWILRPKIKQYPLQLCVTPLIYIRLVTSYQTRQTAPKPLKSAILVLGYRRIFPSRIL